MRFIVDIDDEIVMMSLENYAFTHDIAPPEKWFKELITQGKPGLKDKVKVRLSTQKVKPDE